MAFSRYIVWISLKTLCWKVLVIFADHHWRQHAHATWHAVTFLLFILSQILRYSVVSLRAQQDIYLTYCAVFGDHGPSVAGTSFDPGVNCETTLIMQLPELSVCLTCPCGWLPCESADTPKLIFSMQDLRKFYCFICLSDKLQIA